MNSRQVLAASSAIAAAVFSSGCVWQHDDHVARFCSFQPIETLPLGESWHGVTAEDARARLDGATGDWAVYVDPFDGEPVPLVTLEARAELAGPAAIHRFLVDETGEPCGDHVQLGVPLNLELASADGTWSFSGEIVLYYSVDLGWNFNSAHLRGPRAVLDTESLGSSELLDERLPHACSQSTQLVLHGPHGEGAYPFTELVALCPDGLTQEILQGPWRADPL